MDLQKLKKSVSGVFKSHPEIESAYLFGSTAMGKARAKSDADFAIRLTPGVSASISFDLRLQLMDELEKSIGTKVDIVILNTASLKMIRQVLVHGHLLYARKESAEQIYAVQKRREYFDFQYLTRKNRREMNAYFGVR